MAGVAFTNAGLGIVHAIAMTVGAEYDTPHGATIGAVLPASIRYNVPSNPERYATVARLLDESVEELSPIEAGEQCATAVERLVSDLGLPVGLCELGVEANDISMLVDKTLRMERLLAGNPRRIDEERIEALYQQAL